VRATEGALYFDTIDQVELLPGAREFVFWLAERGHAVVLSSSAKPEEIAHYVEMLDVGDAIVGHTDAGDVEAAKPAPDVIQAGLEKLGDRARAGAVMVGDSVYDVQAASAAGLETLGVLTGGFGGEELRAVGALEVFAGLADLRDHVRKTPLNGGNDAPDGEH
jgi:phosphoglycolate phosphatase-like HAD superfamily hydrolase